MRNDIIDAREKALHHRIKSAEHMPMRHGASLWQIKTLERDASSTQITGLLRRINVAEKYGDIGERVVRRRWAGASNVSRHYFRGLGALIWRLA